MPEINIKGIDKPVTVGDDFLKLSLDEQNAAIDEIARQVRGKQVAQKIQGMSAGQIAMSAAEHLPESALQFGKDIVQPFIHPIETGKNIGMIGKGVLEKTGLLSGDDAVKYADAVGGWLMGRYGSWDAIKQTMATDPVGLAADLSVVLTGGGAAVARSPGVLGRVGKVAGAAGRVIDPVNAVAIPAQAAARGINLVGRPQHLAVADVARALDRDDMTVRDLRGAAQDAAAAGRPGVSVVDVGGENVRGLMERVAQTPGAGRTIVQPFLTGRQTAQAERLAGDLSELTGTQRSALEAINETIQQRATQARPLYAAAMNFNAQADAHIAAAWQRATSTGWGNSILNSSTLRKNLQSEFGIKDINQAPLMVVIDAWKKVADDTIGASLRAGNKNAARVIENTRDSVLDVVRQKNPNYQQALSAWAGPSKYLDAIEAGKDILSKKTSAEELLANISKLGDSEKEAYRIGAVSAIVAKMRGDPAKLGDMTKYLRSPEVRDKVAAIMPTKGAAEAFNKRVDLEIRSSELVGQSLRGSPTAKRVAEMQDAGGLAAELTGDLVMHAFAGTPSVGWMRRMAGVTLSKMGDTLRSQADQRLAEILTGSPGNLRKPWPMPSARTTGRAAYQAGRLEDVLNNQQ